MLKLNQTVAQNIVLRAMKIIGNSVNVMDENGVIIASGNPERLNQKHVGAVLAIRENRLVEIDDELAQRWHFEAQPGINVPINYLGRILGVVGISGVPEKVKPYAELVKMTAELIIEQHILLEQERWERRYKEEFVLQLLKGESDDETLRRQADFFAFDLSLPHATVIIRLLHPAAGAMQRLVTYLEQFGREQPLAVLALDRVALLSPVSHVQQLVAHKNTAKFLPSDVHLQDYRIAVGAYSNRHFPLRLSYQTAVSTLNYGQKCFPKKALHTFDQYRLPVLLDDLAHTWQAEKLLKPLQNLYTRDENKVLQKTLQQYFLSNCDPAHTSAQLFVHVNTLRYRLNRIEQITGLSFNNIDEKFILYLSTILAS